MATIIIITPPPTRPKHQKVEYRDAQEFERPDGESLAESLRAIADQVEAEE